jgi:DNA/RNA endonuclease G (NUC1)
MSLARAGIRRTCVTRTCAIAALIVIAASPGQAAVSDADAKEGIIECTDSHLKEHNPDLAGRADTVVCFLAYVSNFNTKPRQIGGKPRFLGVPHWVVHHIAKAPNAPETKDRPNSWFTVPDLAKQGIAPTDDSYAFSKAFREKNKNWYERGHLAQKYLAERLGGKSGWFTHNVVNAVPQRSQFNKGPWLTLECYTGAWANKFGEVWVVAGPVYRKNKPVVWLKSDANKKALPVAIPVAMYKIVARKQQDGQWAVLGFIYPQTHPSYSKRPYDPGKFMHTIAEIERLSGEEFLSGLPDAAALKKQTGVKLWPVAASDFDPGCASQKATVL